MFNSDEHDIVHKQNYLERFYHSRFLEAYFNIKSEEPRNILQAISCLCAIGPTVLYSYFPYPHEIFSHLKVQ